MAGMHMYDFEEVLNDDLPDILERLTSCEERTDTLYTHARTRVGEIDGTPVAALLSYPGELYREVSTYVFWKGIVTGREHTRGALFLEAVSEALRKDRAFQEFKKKNAPEG